jgi:hypothetical protein
MERSQGGAQGCLLLVAEQVVLNPYATTLVAHAVRSGSVVPTRNLTDPISGVAGHACNGGGGQPARQEPQKVPAAALDRVMGLAVPLMQLVASQIWVEDDASWHAPVLQQFRVTRYHYPYRLSAHRNPKTHRHRGSPKILTRPENFALFKLLQRVHDPVDDPGGHGWEIARELIVCPACAVVWRASHPPKRASFRPTRDSSNTRGAARTSRSPTGVVRD